MKSAKRPYRIRARERSGRCFELCSEGQMRDPTWTLVHGTARSMIDGTIAHAWLERDGVVYDAVLDKEMPCDQYYARFDAKVERRYSHKEAARACMASPEATKGKIHYGPWHETRGFYQRLGNTSTMH